MMVSKRTNKNSLKALESSDKILAEIKKKGQTNSNLKLLKAFKKILDNTESVTLLKDLKTVKTYFEGSDGDRLAIEMNNWGEYKGLKICKDDAGKIKEKKNLQSTLEWKKPFKRLSAIFPTPVQWQTFRDKINRLNGGEDEKHSAHSNNVDEIKEWAAKNLPFYDKSYGLNPKPYYVERANLLIQLAENKKATLDLIEELETKSVPKGDNIKIYIDIIADKVDASRFKYKAVEVQHYLLVYNEKKNNISRDERIELACKLLREKKLFDAEQRLAAANEATRGWEDKLDNFKK